MKVEKKGKKLGQIFLFDFSGMQSMDVNPQLVIKIEDDNNSFSKLGNPPKKTNCNKYFFIAIIVVILAGVGTGVYFLFRNQGSKEVSTTIFDKKEPKTGNKMSFTLT